MDFHSSDKKWGEMNGSEKVVFLGQLIAFICTFGFAYPNVLHDPHYYDNLHR